MADKTNKTKKEKPKEDLSDEQLDDVSGGVVRRAVMLPADPDADQKLTSDTSKLRRRQ
jgi:hypothetical protein